MAEIHCDFKTKANVLVSRLSPHILLHIYQFVNLVFGLILVLSVVNLSTNDALCQLSEIKQLLIKFGLSQMTYIIEIYVFYKFHSSDLPIRRITFA